MTATRPMTRRDVARGIAASAAASVLPCPSFAQATAHIVVIGGGFGGASCARALRRLDPKLQVSLIEPNQTFTACPFSNEVIAGMRELAAQQFTYDKIAAGGVTVTRADGSVTQIPSTADWVAIYQASGMSDGSTTTLFSN